MREANNIQKGDLIQVNGKTHKITDASEGYVTITSIGEMPRDYVQKGIDNGKIDV